LEEKQAITHFKTPYILIPNGKETLEQAYTSFITDADILKKATDGKINLYKTGTNKKTSMYLFDAFTKFVLNPEPIKQQESIWIKKASKGAIIFSEPYEGTGYKYDVKSMYPSIMNGMLLCPLKQGEFHKLDSLAGLTYYQFGIYRCVIEKSSDPNTNKLFRFNFDNFYTHISLTQADKLGLKIKLILDDEPNFLYYSRDSCITSHELFGKFIDYTFPLKDAKYPRMKQIINTLWGALAEIRYDTAQIRNDDEIFVIEDIYELFELKPDIHNEENTIYKTTNFHGLYKSNFARLAPFLISKGRSMISDIAFPYKEDIRWIHTDGLISSKEPVGIQTGNKLGSLVFEGFTPNCQIIHCNKIIGEFVV